MRCAMVLQEAFSPLRAHRNDVIEADILSQLAGRIGTRNSRPF